ncbi:pilus motility taxis protein HmpF [Leptolyngbya sp. DQ-M1]|uniref:pilus motility taxis protein HmpF n=1 Tax=Leptolyngbya sp. DQ-M1 TaxID=2933920 RepID=UPI003297D13C
MLYLAEVVQKKGGIMGGGKSELKLLACQRAEQNWSAITAEEIIAADEASKFGSGTLLLVDLTGNKQVQRVQEAGRPIANILQTFSRLQDKIKTKEVEIEQWNESLTYQSQELTRREMEMEARQEELKILEAECQQIEQQRQEFEAEREELARQQQELERNRQELEGAWEQLHGQKRQLEEQQAELFGACVLDEAKAQELYQWLDRLVESGTSPEAMQQCHELLNYQQSLLTHHWQTLEEQRHSAEQMRQDIDQQAHHLAEQWQAWEQAQVSLEQAKIELGTQHSLLQSQQEFAGLLRAQIEYQTQLHQQLQNMVEGVDSDAPIIDVQALETMDLGELRSVVQGMQREFDQSSQFVHHQDEELRLKEEEIQALKDKIAQVNEFDRMSLETELTDEQDAYEFLHQTLVGQRRSLREKEAILRQHKAVLVRRGGAEPDRERELDFSIVFSQIEAQRQKQAEKLQQIEAQIQELELKTQQLQHQVNEQSGNQDAKRSELEQIEAALQVQRVTAAELAGKASLYQEMLQPVQDSIAAMGQHLEAIAQSGGQHHVIGEMKAVIANLTQSPQYAVA